MAWSFLHAPALVCLALCAAPGASAADRAPSPEPAVPLPPVHVPAPAEPRPEAPDRRDVTADVTVVERREVSGAEDAADWVVLAPGLGVHAQGGPGQARAASARAVGPSGVAVLLDGMPLGGAAGLTDLSRVPSSLIERVEVVRGAAGARYGSGGLGAVINIVSRTASHVPRLDADLSYGSFQTVRGQLSGSSPFVGGDAMLVLHGATSQGNFPFQYTDAVAGPVLGVRQNNAAGGGGGLFKLTKALASGWTAHLLAEGYAEKRGLAGTVDQPSRDALQETQRGALSARFARALDSGELVARAHGRVDRLSLTASPFGDSRQLLAVMAAELDASSLVGRHGLGLHLDAGLEALRDGTGRHPAWGRGSVVLSDDLFFSEGLWTVSGSARVSRTGPYTTVSPKVGTTLLLPRGFELRANIAQAERVPSFLELYVRQGTLLPNEDLRPERAVSTDLQVAHRTGSSHVALTGFYARYWDLIVYEYYPPLVARAQNLAFAHGWGLEAEASARWSIVSVRSAYTLLFTENLDRTHPAYFLQPLPYRPRHRWEAQLAVGPEALQLVTGLSVQSEQRVNRTADAPRLPSRAFLDVGLTWRALGRPGLSVYVRAQNVLDVHARDLDGYPLPGRALYAGCSLALEGAPTPEAAR